jgi:hypothetical protein
MDPSSNSLVVVGRWGEREVRVLDDTGRTHDALSPIAAAASGSKWRPADDRSTVLVKGSRGAA